MDGGGRPSRWTKFVHDGLTQQNRLVIFQKHTNSHTMQSILNLYLIYNAFLSGFYNRHRRQHEIDQKTNEILNSMIVLAHKEPTPDHPIFKTLSTIFRQSIEEDIKVRFFGISSKIGFTRDYFRNDQRQCLKGVKKLLVPVEK